MCLANTKKFVKQLQKLKYNTYLVTLDYAGKKPIIWLEQHTHIFRKGLTKYAYWIFDEG